MSSRGKKIVSLVLNNSATQGYQSSSESDSEPIQHSTVVADVYNTNKSRFVKRRQSGRQPVPRVARDEYVGDVIEMEMESLFGDVSDNEDPTYIPSCSHHMDRDGDLITLRDLLEEEPANEEAPRDFLEDYLQPSNDGVDGLLDQNNIIQLLQEENRKQKELADIAYSILEEILNKMWKKVKPLKRWIKSNLECWAINVAKKRRADGLPYKSRSKDRPAKVPKDITIQNVSLNVPMVTEFPGVTESPGSPSPLAT